MLSLFSHDSDESTSLYLTRVDPESHDQAGEKLEKVGKKVEKR